MPHKAVVFHVKVFVVHMGSPCNYKIVEAVVANFETTIRDLLKSKPHLMPHGISVSGLVGHALIHKTEPGIIWNELLLAG